MLRRLVRPFVLAPARDLIVFGAVVGLAIFLETTGFDAGSEIAKARRAESQLDYERILELIEDASRAEDAELLDLREELTALRLKLAAIAEAAWRHRLPFGPKLDVIMAAVAYAGWPEDLNSATNLRTALEAYQGPPLDDVHVRAIIAHFGAAVGFRSAA